MVKRLQAGPNPSLNVILIDINKRNSEMAIDITRANIIRINLDDLFRFHATQKVIMKATGIRKKRMFANVSGASIFN
jgi:hypothetical protein